MAYVGKILRIALPVMVENVLQMLMGVVDSYLIAQLGLVAVSGISLANNVTAIYQALFIALGAAVSSLVAQSQLDRVQQSRLRANALSLTLMLGLCLGLLSVFAGHHLLNFLGAESEVVKTGALYLGVVGGGVVSLGLMTILGAILRAQGRADLPMYVSLLANGINALFSAIAVFVFNQGIVAVALATIFSRLFGAMVLASQLPIFDMMKAMSWRLDKTMLSLSIPAAGERLMMRAGDVVVVGLIVGLGTEVVAGNAIGETLTQFNYMPGMAVATATVILVASSPASDRPQLIKISYLLASLSMLGISLVAVFLSQPLIFLFTNNSRAVRSASLVLLASLLGTFFTAGTLIFTALWQGLGDSKLPFYATTIGMWCVRIFLSYILIRFFQFGLEAIWIGTLIDNMWRSFYLYGRYRVIKNKS